MEEAGRDAQVRRVVGFNYLCNPGIVYARQLIDSGALGDIWSFRGLLRLDANTDPDVPFTWRFERARSGSGALGDVGAHVISLARALVGPIAAGTGLSATVI